MMARRTAFSSHVPSLGEYTQKYGAIGHIFNRNASVSYLVPDHRHTIISPQTFKLIAHSDICRGTTIEISFYALKLSDQFYFRCFAYLCHFKWNSMLFRFYFSMSHSALPAYLLQPDEKSNDHTFTIITLIIFCTCAADQYTSDEVYNYSRPSAHCKIQG